MKTSIILFFSIIISMACCGQTKGIDSLKKVLNQSEEDSFKVNNLLVLSKLFFGISPEQSISYAIKARDLALKIDFPDGVGYAYKNIGIVNYMQANYLESLGNYDKALAIFKSTGNKAGMANILSNQASLYFNRADEAKALELNLQSLRIAEQIGDTLRILTALQNIGAIYSNKSISYNQALSYFLRALPMSEALKNNDAIGTISVNIGEVYLANGNEDTALIYFKKSLDAFKGSENVPYSLNEIGKLYLAKNDFTTALKYHTEALDISQKLNAKVDMAQSLLGLGNVYNAMKEINTAIAYYKKAVDISATISDANYILEKSYEGLAATYSEISDFKNAFRYQALFTNIKDSLYNNDITKKLASLQFNFDIQKKQSQIDLLEKDRSLKNLALNKQLLIRNVLLIGLALLGFIAIILYRNYKHKIKTNKLLDSQKAQIEGLLLNILPAEVAEELQTLGNATPRYYEQVSILFTDFKGFTRLVETLSPQQVVHELDAYFMAFDDIIEKYQLEKIKTIGDSYMCAGGIPTEDKSHLINIIKAGFEMQEYIDYCNRKRIDRNLPEWHIRIGINTGPVVAGVVGKKKYAYDIWGSAVNIASRMESNGEAGKVNISAATYELIKEKYACTYRGKIFAKNVGEVDMYFVDEEIREAV